MEQRETTTSAELRITCCHSGAQALGSAFLDPHAAGAVLDDELGMHEVQAAQHDGRTGREVAHDHAFSHHGCGRRARLDRERLPGDGEAGVGPVMDENGVPVGCCSDGCIDLREVRRSVVVDGPDLPGSRRCTPA
jgi:hypothetical protein